MRVHWTNTAIEHLLSIHEHISLTSKIYADRLVDRLTKRSEQIGMFPESGRVVPEYRRDDLREVIEQSYRIIYRINEQQIDVLAVVHGAREFPL